MPEINVLDPTGHTKHIWDADKPDEVEAAEALYDALVAKGYRAFHVKVTGGEGKRMDEFDPEAEKMILVPALRGG